MNFALVISVICDSSYIYLIIALHYCDELVKLKQRNWLEIAKKGFVLVQIQYICHSLTLVGERGGGGSGSESYRVTFWVNCICVKHLTYSLSNGFCKCYCS